LDQVDQEDLRDHTVRVRLEDHMGTDPKVQEDLWEDHRLVLLLTVIRREVHLPEQCQRKVLAALRCHMEVPQICTIYKGC